MKLELLNNIGNKIHTLRNLQVVLDGDLADLYETEAKFINQAVRRNLNRFNERFVFKLTEEEWKDLKIKSKHSKRGNMKFQSGISQKLYLKITLPNAFTEEGVAMLSAVLNTEAAVRVNIHIMQAFLSLRKFLPQNTSIFQRLNILEQKQLKSDERTERLFNILNTGQPDPDKGIFFNGEVFDAVSFVTGVIEKATIDIVLIDNDVDETILTILAKRKEGVAATIYTKVIPKSLELDIDKHNSQFPPVSVKIFAPCHDRFLLLDGKELYHFDASLKDLGKKWLAFSRMDSMAEVMINQLKKEGI